ncbi:MAG TPA: NUDIX hydrolase [Gallionellaceae bacterium]
MDNKSYQVTIKGLCFDESGRLLLVKEASGYWDLPGGRMEHGEDFHSTLTRECLEEMGISCEILDSTPYWAWPAVNYDRLWKIVACFRIRLPHYAFTASDECVALDFFAPDELVTLRLAPQIQPLQNWLPRHGG